MKDLAQLLSLAALALVLSCGQQGSPVLEDPTAETSATKNLPTKRKFYPFSVVMNGQGRSTSKLHLAGIDAPASAQDFSIDLTNCDSTHSATVTSSVAFLELYEFDRHCLAKLTSFMFNDTTYTPKAGTEFSTWQTSDTAIFEKVGASPADELLVTILETIPSPIASGGKIHYQFSEITQGASQTILESAISKSASLTVDGQASPDFSIRKIELVNITSDGNGEFRFLLECNQAMTSDPQTLNPKCYSVDLNTIKMTLAENVGNKTSLSYADLVAIFNKTDLSNKNIIASIDRNNMFPANTTSTIPHLPNGGFITANTGEVDVMKLGEPSPITTHRNMIFALRSGPYDPADPNSRSSFTYFFITVSTIVQSGDQR